MNWSNIEKRGYIKRHEQEALGLPVGDPHSGPAYGQYNDIGSALGAGASILGGAIGSDSADTAANAQTQAAAQADATQRYMYDTTRSDQAPFLKTGTSANSKLAFLLGLGGSPTGGSSYNTLSSADLVDTSKGDWRPNAELYQNNPQYKAEWDNFIRGHSKEFGVMPNLSRGSDLGKTQSYLASKIDLNAYNKAQQDKSKQVQENDPTYGSLLRSFSANDLESDPIYQSTYQNALDTGTKAANQQASATGSLLSGNTLKALTRFGANTAATYGNDAYNRYNTNQSNVYNRLAGISGTGQTAAGQVAASGQNYANNVSANQIGLGNARGASAIAQGNALTSGINSLGNLYQNSQYGNTNTANSQGFYPGTYNGPNVFGTSEGE